MSRKSPCQRMEYATYATDRERRIICVPLPSYTVITSSTLLYVADYKFHELKTNIRTRPNSKPVCTQSQRTLLA